MRWLITCFDSRPALRGGIATFGHELSNALAQIPGEEVLVLAPTCQEAVEFDKQQNYKTKRVDLPRKSIRAIWPLRRHLKQQIKEFKPDIIVNFLWLPEGVSTIGLGVPRIVIAHGVEVLESSATFRKKMRQTLVPFKKWVFKKAFLTIAVSRYTADLLQKYCGLEKEKILIIHPGVTAAPERPLRIKEAPLNFLTVTRLLPYKGVDVVLKSLALLKKTHTNWHYNVVGGGIDLERLQIMIMDLGLEKFVTLLGQVDDKTLEKCYQQTDLFILCSRADLVTPNVEGFGIVFLEAAMLGIPSLAGNSGGISDAVLDGETGWTVDPEDSNVIARNLSDIINTPQELALRGKKARARALLEFQWGQIAVKLKDVVQSKKNHLK